MERVSKYYETEPYGMTEQPDFLNACLELRTLLASQELLKVLQKIEQDAGEPVILQQALKSIIKSGERYVHTPAV